MELTTGLQIFHNGIPVRLLYTELPGFWWVKPLFVEEPDRIEEFKPNDRITLLHTRKP